MDSATNTELVYEFPFMIRVYKNGRVERLAGTATVPASVDPVTGVQSKDIVISPETGVSARIYIPKSTPSHQKLPLLVYFHGGGFCVESPFSPAYHSHLNSLVAEANVVAVSVDYRRAPENPLPTAYDDSWVALNWVFSHSARNGPEGWLIDHADFDRVFLAGDSAGANIAHNIAIRVGAEKPDGISLVGIVLIHPYFWGKDPLAGESANPKMKEYIDGLWKVAYPESSGLDDPVLNPVLDPNLSGLGCGRVLICVAEKDSLRDRGWYYQEALGKCGWGGVAEVIESEGEHHVFHLHNPTAENSVAMLKRVASFLNMRKP